MENSPLDLHSEKTTVYKYARSVFDNYVAGEMPTESRSRRNCRSAGPSHRQRRVHEQAVRDGYAAKESGGSEGEGEYEHVFGVPDRYEYCCISYEAEMRTVIAIEAT